MPVSAHRLSLYRRSNRVYYIGYYLDGRRRWKSTGVTTRPEALKALTEFSGLLDYPQRNVRYPQFCDEFISYAAMQNAPRTVALFRLVLRGFGVVAKNAFLKDITSLDIDRFKAKRLKEIKPVSVNVELRMLKSAFATACRWKLVDENPCRGYRSSMFRRRLPSTWHRTNSRD